MKKWKTCNKWRKWRKWKKWKPIADYRKRIRKMMDEKQVLTREARNQVGDRFVEVQARILLAAGLLWIGILLCMAISSFFRPESITLKRGDFGKGVRDIPLVLEQNGREEDYLLHLEEQEISREQEAGIFKTFFKKVEKSIVGKNSSLKEVRNSLSFPDSIRGYPFSLSYQPEDQDIIDLNGDLGKKGSQLKAGSLRTRIRVTAAYKNFRRSKDFEVIVLSPDVKRKTDLEKAADALEIQERESRNLSEVTLPSSIRGVRVKRPGQAGFPSVWMALLLLVTLLPLFRHYSLKDKVQRVRREAEADFSLIVHLFTLFMGAGLSFPSAVARISQAYREGKVIPERRVAFDRVLVMENRMRDGISGKEALREWACTYSYGGYRKLALILTQCMTKGQKEAMLMMEKEERQAFSDRIDKARMEGEEARTRLLFPMIVLLAVTLFLVMFPALVNFYHF